MTGKNFLPNLSKVSFQDQKVDICLIYFGFILAFLGLSAFIRLATIVRLYWFNHIIFCYLHFQTRRRIESIIGPIWVTRIFGAYGPIMFALRVWVGFGASWKDGTFLRKAVFFNSSFMFGRTHCIMFGKTLFEDCVRKDTLHYVRKDTFQKVKVKDVLYKCPPINFKGHTALCSEGHFSEKSISQFKIKDT